MCAQVDVINELRRSGSVRRRLRGKPGKTPAEAEEAGDGGTAEAHRSERG